jgi:F0F1-type ATP synthase membrane subunit b/b'
MEKLGINPALIVVQIINFVLFVIILKKVLYKPVLQ